MINRILLIIVVVAVVTSGSSVIPDPGPPPSFAFDFAWEARRAQALDPDDYANVRNLLDSEQPILSLYREDVTHDAVVDFFVALTGSSEIALPILYHADREGLSLSLVFALAWVESRYSPVAVNQNATSTDRGLFQLNSLTFRDLSEEDFFHPDVNALHGTQFLTWCMERTESEMQAVACYNAGLTRVRAGRTPASTLVYVRRISEFRTRLLSEFRAFVLREFPSQAT